VRDIGFRAISLQNAPSAAIAYHVALKSWRFQNFYLKLTNNYLIGNPGLKADFLIMWWGWENFCANYSSLPHG